MKTFHLTGKTMMRSGLVVAALICVQSRGFGQSAQTPGTAPTYAGQPSEIEASVDYSTGLFNEEIESDLPAAVAAYRRTIQAFDQQRAEAANAIFRLGEVYRKLGRLEEAKVHYARILREFPDMIRLTELSHKLLFGEEPKSVGSTGGGFGGGGGLGGGGGGGGMGAGFGVGTGAQVEVSSNQVDWFPLNQVSNINGMVLRMQRPKSPAAESGEVAAPGGGSPGDPGYYERLMMQRYGIVPGRLAPVKPGESSDQGFASEQAERTACFSNLRQLGLAARIYATDHQDTFPPTVGLMSHEISVTKVLVCPSDKERQPASSWDELDPLVHISYEYAGASASEKEPQQVLLRCPLHGHVARVDGSVQQGNDIPQRVAPQMTEILRRRYGLGGAAPSSSSTEPESPLVIAITVARDSAILVNGGPMDLEGLTEMIEQMPDDMRATTLIKIEDDAEAESSPIIEVINACQQAGISRFSVAIKGSSLAVGQEIERLKREHLSLSNEMQLNRQQAYRLNQQLAPFNPAIDQARARQTLAKERLEALSFPADRLPAVVGQDARYQRLKAEYETAVLDGDEAAQKRTFTRLQEWVDRIYRPELEVEMELADRQFAALAEPEEFLSKQRTLKAQRADLESKLNVTTHQIQALEMLSRARRAEAVN